MEKRKRVELQAEDGSQVQSDQVRQNDNRQGLADGIARNHQLDSAQDDSINHSNSADIEREVKLRRKSLLEEEKRLTTMLGKARLERAILIRARVIIDERIENLQRRVSSSVKD